MARRSLCTDCALLCLKSKSQDAWLQRAIDHTDEVLVDHAHCERKAATQALISISAVTVSAMARHGTPS